MENGEWKDETITKRQHRETGRTSEARGRFAFRTRTHASYSPTQQQRVELVTLCTVCHPERWRHPCRLPCVAWPPEPRAQCTYPYPSLHSTHNTLHPQYLDPHHLKDLTLSLTPILTDYLRVVWRERARRAPTNFFPGMRVRC
jgi:hypothetical protein